jgi:hypothetical protein
VFRDGNQGSCRDIGPPVLRAAERAQRHRRDRDLGVGLAAPSHRGAAPLSACSSERRRVSEGLLSRPFLYILGPGTPCVLHGQRTIEVVLDGGTHHVYDLLVSDGDSLINGEDKAREGETKQLRCH